MSTNQTQTPVILERMTAADLPEVMRIDAASFPKPWPEPSWRHEVEDNANARCWAAREAPARRTLLQRVFGAPSPRGEILGLVCMWIVFDEAHIATIAVRPDARGRRIGDALMRTCVQQACAENCSRMLLEVRVSNLVAQHLYRRYGFQVIGRRPRYYTDNQEDALVMTIEKLADRCKEGIRR